MDRVQFIHYDDDELGNRTIKSVGNYTTTYHYSDSQNRLDSAEGGPAPLKTMTFTWDLAGRLASSSDGVSYLYDGLGRRIQKTEPSQTTLFHYDSSGRIISETKPDGTKIRDYIYLGNKLVAVDGCITVSPPSACTERQWYHTDIAGSVLARSDSAGNIVRFDYQPWGEPWTAPATAAGDRQYNGRIFDANTGFHDYGARMYWPEIGRFISVDSAGPTLANPATFNRYAYVLNNPYKYVDPNGKWPTPIHIDIINRAFQGLSPEQLQILIDASAYVDRLANQFQAGNYEHAMRGPDEDPATARAAIDARISGMSAYAQMLQGTTPGSSADINPEALRIFGEGAHTVMDRTSPAHTDPNGDPRPWEPTHYSAHKAEESTISPEQRAAAAKLLRDYFISTFGELTLWTWQLLVQIYSYSPMLVHQIYSYSLNGVTSMKWRIIVSSLVLGAVTIAVLLMAGIYLADSSKLIYIVLFCLAMPGVAVSLLVCLEGPSTGTGICGTYGWAGLILVFNYAFYSCVWLVILMVWQRHKRGKPHEKVDVET